MRMDRRSFLRVSAFTVAAANVPTLVACGDDEEPGPSGPGQEEIDRVFPQGLASGDPRPNQVTLWTRVEPEAGEGDIPVKLEVATDAGFSSLLLTEELTARADEDHTLRVNVTELQPYTQYHYRFTARDIPIAGRTKTAPAPDADVPVRFAFASCQDFVGRYYHAWDVLANEPAVDFVLFLGDYIYETDGDVRFQVQGGRTVVFPDGEVIAENAEGQPVTRAAKTLADYRVTWRTYKKEPALKKIHALYPFINVWDDHEFANDAWGAHTTHFSEEEGKVEDVPDQRQIATRVFAEYLPVDWQQVSYDADAPWQEQIRLYRNLRFGRHMELFVTDERLYRSDHLIPEGPVNVPTGKTGTNTSLGSRNLVIKPGFDAAEAAADPKPTMLGATQKSWLVDGVTNSTATWKLWGTEVQLTQMAIDLREFELGPFAQLWYFSTDQWDGYRSERAEILRAFREAATTNVVSIAGDIHASYASEIYVDFDNIDNEEPVLPEFAGPGISSQAVQDITRDTIAASPTLSSIEALADLVPRFDEILSQGSPHIRFARSRSNGVCVVDLTAQSVTCTWLLVNPDNVLQPAFDGNVERISYKVNAGSPRIVQG